MAGRPTSCLGFTIDRVGRAPSELPHPADELMIEVGMAPDFGPRIIVIAAKVR